MKLITFVHFFTKLLLVVLFVFNTTNSPMDYVTIKTRDNEYISLEKSTLAFSTTLHNVLQDSDEKCDDTTVTIPMSSKNFMILAPVIDTMNEIACLQAKKDLSNNKQEYSEEEKVQRKVYKNNLKHYKQELKRTLIKQIHQNQGDFFELLNDSNFLDCLILTKTLMNLLVENINITFEEGNSLDAVLEWVSNFDIPHELSVELGNKILEAKTPVHEYDVIKNVIAHKNIQTYTLSENKKFCAYVENNHIVTICDTCTNSILFSHTLNDIEAIKGIYLSPDMLYIALHYETFDEQHFVEIFNTKTAQFIERISGNNESITYVDFSKKGERVIVSTSINGLILGYLNKPKKALDVFEYQGAVGPFCFDASDEIKPIDRSLLLKRQLRDLFVHYQGLVSELKKLSLAQVLLYMELIEQKIEGRRGYLLSKPLTRQFYESMLTNPTVYASLQKPESSQSRCILS